MYGVEGRSRAHAAGFSLQLWKEEGACLLLGWRVRVCVRIPNLPIYRYLWIEGSECQKQKIYGLFFSSLEA